MSKPFSVDLHTANDAAAKETLIKALRAQGIDAIENPDPYGVDIIATNKAMSYEVEVKHNWDAGEFPFDSVHIPARKLKFLNQPVKFVILSSNRNWAIVIDGEVVKASKIIEKDTKLTRGERFIEVPAQKAALVSL